MYLLFKCAVLSSVLVRLLHRSLVLQYLLVVCTYRGMTGVLQTMSSIEQLS